MRKLNEVEVYLLEHWEDIAKLQEAAENLERKIDSLAEEAVSSLKNQEWWTDEFQVKPTKDEIYIFKRTWKVGKGEWDLVCIGFWGLRLKNLMETSDYPPAVYVWSEQLKERRSEFRDKFKKYSEEIRNSKGIKMSGDEDENYPLYIYLPQTPQEWLEIIKTGRFVEEIVNSFNNTLVPLIDPIDRALAEVMKKKGKK